MKKLFGRVFAVALVLCMLCAAATAQSYTPGVYTATEYGMMGDVVVTMTFSETEITDVQAQGDKETPGIGTLALEAIPQAILSAQGTAVDAVAGATITGDAIVKAAQACIAHAQGEAAAAQEEKEVGFEADVIVIGAGAGGLSAAESAAKAGASVIVLEAAGRAGGSAILSGGNMNSLAPEMLEQLGRNDKDVSVYLDQTADMYPAEYAQDLAKVQEDVKAYLADTSITAAYDSVERIMLDHYKKGYGLDLEGNEAKQDYAYIRKGVEANEEIYQWLLDGGITFKAPTTKHYVTPNSKGAELIEVLLSMAEGAGADVVYNTRAIELLTDENGKVNGVVAIAPDGQNVTYTAKGGVVIATGSFAANVEMFDKYQNVATGTSTNTSSSNPETNIGDGIVMAQALGAKLEDMQYVGFIWRGYKSLASTAEAGTLGTVKQFAVNEEGVRFTEDSGSNLQKPAINETDAIVNMIGDKAMYDALEASKEGTVADMEGRGILFVGETIEEAAEKAGLDPAVLAESVKTFNAAVDAGVDEAFGRTKFNGKVETAPFVIAKCQAVNHLTYGGLVTDLEAKVLKEDNSAIDGLYAVGDVVTGFEGANHQTGECLTIVMYYGRVAGANAAAK